MAINISDFDKIWASTSPLTPYAFSDANYKQGWNFVGATPPARQMWDFLQKQNDEKTQWLYNNKLSLSGGTMTGAITGNPVILTADDGNGNTKSLIANADGTLTWSGKEIERVNAIGSDYIRYESGLQVCWGAIGSVTTDGKAVTFPVAFNSSPTVFSTGSGNYIAWASSVTTTTCNVRISSGTNTVKYLAIGSWK